MGKNSDGLRQRTNKSEKQENDIVSEKNELEQETWWQVLIQVTPPYLCAGLGMVGAGLVLDHVQYWDVFQSLPELFIMVPALIGLKGNLEMTLASRLSTHANLGDLDTFEQTIEMGAANLALIQVQGIVVGGLASIMAMMMAWLGDIDRVDIGRALILTSSSVVTASAASFILGLVMLAVIAVSRRYNVNPDNVATPIAAALGDLVTLSLLACVALFLTSTSNSLIIAILIGYITLIPICSLKANKNIHTAEILRSGWTPVLSAMVISSMGGKILNNVIVRFPDIAVFQPVINGVAGNLVGIQSSRISTDLHKSSKLGNLPTKISSYNLLNPFYTFSPSSCSSSPMLSANATAALVLLLLVIPGHLIFNLAIAVTQGFKVLSSVTFLVFYLLAAFIQVGSLLYIANVMVHKMWQQGVNPDNCAIPYLTALGDLLGGALLACVFILF